MLCSPLLIYDVSRTSTIHRFTMRAMERVRLTPGRLIARLFFERKDERTMKHFWKRFVVCSLCLVTFLLAFGTPLTSYAARTVPQLPSDDPPGTTCVPTDPLNWGISYDATEYFGFVVTDEPWEQDLGAFGSGGSPFIAAWTCGVNTIILGSSAEGGLDQCRDHRQWSHNHDHSYFYLCGEDLE